MGEKKSGEAGSSRSLGNIRKGREEKLYKQAAKNTGFRITIHQEAYDVFKIPMLGYSSLWTQEPLGRDHGPLFEEAERLRQIENS